MLLKSLKLLNTLKWPELSAILEEICNNKIKMLHFITQIQITDTRAFNPSQATPKIYQVQ